MSELDATLRSLAREPAVSRLLNGVLDRRDRKGRFPRTYTARWEDLEPRVLERFLPPQVLRRKSDGGVVVDLARLQELMDREATDHGREAPRLPELFDALTGREPRNLWHDREGWREAVARALHEGEALGRERAGEGGDAALDALIAEAHDALAAGRGPWLRLSREVGLDEVRERFAVLVAAFLVARRPRGTPLRLDQLSLAAAGDTKVLRPGTPDHRRLTEALLAAEADLAGELGGAPSTSSALRERLFLERLGIVTNEAPLDVLVRGDLALEIAGESFDEPRRLARHGLAAKVTWGALRRAERVHTDAGGVLSVENETAFHLCAAALGEHLIVYTGGQPGWTVTRLLERLSASRPDLSFEHAGDLDLAGLHVLRALRRRTGLEVRPRWMDGATYDRCLHLSLPIRAREMERVREARGAWGEPFGGEVLDRLVEHGRWVEQEQVLGVVLGVGGER